MRANDESCDVFLTNLAQILKTNPDGDAEIFEIVADNLVTAAPADNCVEDAMAALNELVAARLGRIEEQPDGKL